MSKRTRNRQAMPIFAARTALSATCSPSAARSAGQPQTNGRRAYRASRQTSPFDRLRIISPKRNGLPPPGWEGFFPYYAGYPEGFARAILESMDLTARTVVFDPWNGSGTTTYAASQLGFASYGFDLNPAMITVARARVLPASEADSIDPLAMEICKYDPYETRSVPEDEPLRTWFDQTTAAHVRTIERSICRQLVGSLTQTETGLRLDNISGLAATFYVGLFAVCRDLTAPFRSTNPTWLRKPRDKEKKINIPRKVIVQKLLKSLRGMATALSERKPPQIFEQGRCELSLADTTTTALPRESVDFVLTSPPYCTRIDYTAATRIELAVMAPLTQTVPKELSRKMIGTTRVPKHEVKVDAAWGVRCNEFLRGVKNHPSKASEIYYYRTHLDYFDKLTKSLQHTSAALKTGGAAILVIQDSYYKELHNPLPSIVEDIAAGCGLTLRRREDFRLGHSMTGINPHTRAYRTSQEVVESVLCFSKN